MQSAFRLALAASLLACAITACVEPVTPPQPGAAPAEPVALPQPGAAPAQPVAPPQPRPPPPEPPPPKEAAPPARLTEAANGVLTPPGPITFQTGTDQLDPASEVGLAALADYLSGEPAMTLVRIEGHTEGTADPRAAQDLSEKRALAVARRLVARGVDCRRLIPVGFGATKPVAQGSASGEPAPSARIVFVRAATAGRPVGGLPVDGGGTVAGDPCR